MVIIKEISYKDGIIKQYKNPIYFFKSTGTSRAVDTKNLWFPTGNIPFEIDIVNEKINRITKLEDKILLDHSFDSNFNIEKYGRFLTLENALISKYLYDTDM